MQSHMLIQGGMNPHGKMCFTLYAKGITEDSTRRHRMANKPLNTRNEGDCIKRLARAYVPVVGKGTSS